MLSLPVHSIKHYTRELRRPKCTNTSTSLKVGISTMWTLFRVKELYEMKIRIIFLHYRSARVWTILQSIEHLFLPYLVPNGVNCSLWYGRSTIRILSYNLGPGPHLLIWFNFTPVWISNHMPSKVWDEITYLFPNFNGVVVGVLKSIWNFIPHFIIGAITYPCWDHFATCPTFIISCRNRSRSRFIWIHSECNSQKFKPCFFWISDIFHFPF